MFSEFWIIYQIFMFFWFYLFANTRSILCIVPFASFQLSIFNFIHSTMVTISIGKTSNFELPTNGFFYKTTDIIMFFLLRVFTKNNSQLWRYLLFPFIFSIFLFIFSLFFIPLTLLAWKSIIYFQKRDRKKYKRNWNVIRIVFVLNS